MNTTQKNIAGAAPAAVAPQGEYPQLPEGVMFIEQVGGDVIGRPTDYGFKHGRGIVHGAQLFTSEQLRAYFDLGRQSAPVAPALEAPAAPAGWKLVPAKPTDAMLGAAQKAWLADPLRRSSTLYAAALAAAPQAPAAPSIAVVTDEQIDAILDSLGGLGMVIADKRERMRMFARRVLDLAAPAAPAVDAQDAARYRWLRDTSAPPHNFYLSVPHEFKDERYSPREVDAAIDAAIAAQAAAKGAGDA